MFTTKYAVPRQLKDRILELSIIKRQSNFSVVFIFRWLRRKVLLLCQRNERLHEVVSLSFGLRETNCSQGNLRPLSTKQSFKVAEHSFQVPLPNTPLL